jgi:hypothetical protein
MNEFLPGITNAELLMQSSRNFSSFTESGSFAIGFFFFSVVLVVLVFTDEKERTENGKMKKKKKRKYTFKKDL